MFEVFPLYVIALCSLVIAFGTFVNFLILASIRRRQVRHHRARTEAYTGLRRRIQVIEDFLLKAVRGEQSPTRTGESSKIPDPKFQSQRA